MLYKQICLISFTGYGLLTTHTFAGNYYLSADSGDTSCVNATSNDTCNFDCNVFQWKQNFDCGQSGQCNIYCSNENCFETSTISASNVVNNLNVYASAIGDEKECYKSANFTLPNYGNANFSITGTANNPFKLITINSGTNTNQIIIDCDGEDNKDDCKQITINAQNAQYLEINIGDAMLNGDSKSDDPVIINCPQNSNYNGPNAAPCYIKADSGSSIDLVIINTLYGIPMDVYIDGNDILYQDVTITGANIGCTDQTSSGFTSTSPCWYTTTTPAPITTAPTTDAPTSATTTRPPTITTYSPITTTSYAYSSTTTDVLSSYNTYASTLYVTDRYISTVSNIFSSTILFVADTISETDYFIINKMESGNEIDILIASIVAIILISIVIICLCKVTRFRSVKDSHEEAPAAVDENQNNEMEDKRYRYEKQEKEIDAYANNLPSLCMVVTQSGSMMDMVKMDQLEVNTANKYGENGAVNTPVEMEIEGNINAKNKLNLHMENNDDIEIIFEDDEVIAEDEVVVTVKETPMGPSENNAIEIALKNFTTKH
eukprot:141131_1